MRKRVFSGEQRAILLIMLMLAMALSVQAQGDGEIEPLFTLRHEEIVWGAAWNSDETRLLTWSVDGTVRVWEIPAGLRR